MFKLSKHLIVLFLAIVGQLVAAQPATYENGIFTVPQGAALVNGDPSYYNDIRLQSDVEGNFKLISATDAALVAVESVVVSVAESLPVQVTVSVSGNKSVPCVNLQTPAIFRTGFQFTIALAETRLGPAETCIAVLDPFQTDISLDVTGLDSGTYRVTVNGVEASFNL